MASVLHISETRIFIARHTYTTVDTTKYYCSVLTALGTSQINSISILQDGDETVDKILILRALLQFLPDCRKRLHASLNAGGADQRWRSKTNARLLCYVIGPLQVILQARSITDTWPFHCLCCCCYVQYTVWCAMLHLGVIYVLLLPTLYLSMYAAVSHHFREYALIALAVYYTSLQLTSFSICYSYGQLMLPSQCSQFIPLSLWGITPKEARVEINSASEGLSSHDHVSEVLTMLLEFYVIGSLRSSPPCFYPSSCAVICSDGDTDHNLKMAESSSTATESQLQIIHDTTMINHPCNRD